MLIRPSRSTPQQAATRNGYRVPSDLEMAYENISVPTNDGLHLSGWFIPSDSSPRGTAILLHGIGGSRVNMIRTGSVFHLNGFNVFMYDSRAAGESDGELCTHGFREKYDVVSVIDALRAQYNVDSGHIGLLGVSMGGSVALQAAAIDNRIRCVIAESIYTNLDLVTYDYVQSAFGFRSKFIHDTAIHIAEKEAGFTVHDISPETALQTLHIPILFVHGSKDKLVKPEYSRILFSGYRGTKELYIIEGAGHSDLHTVAGEEYDRRRLSFFERYL